MAFFTPQIKDLVKRVLNDVDPRLVNDAAILLVLGTAAQESHFGTFIRQLGGGPALGFTQIEKPTFEWLKQTYCRLYPEIINIEFEQLEYDLWAAIIFTRLRYRVVRAALPKAENIKEIAAYWKKYYNTYLGAGTIEEFLKNYSKYIKYFL